VFLRLEILDLGKYHETLACAKPFDVVHRNLKLRVHLKNITANGFEIAMRPIDLVRFVG
jgi:hypothetical protein